MFRIQNLLTAQFQSIFISQTLWRLSNVLLHLTDKLQRTSLQFRPSENGWNLDAGSHSTWKHLKYNFLGVFAADNLHLTSQTITIWLWTLQNQILLGHIRLWFATEEMLYTLLILSVFFIGSTPIYLNDWTKNSTRSLNWWQIFPCKTQTLPCAVLLFLHCTFDLW